MAKITRTYGPIHFEDLDPRRFEDLIRELIYDFKDWQSIEATGRAGSDDGIDIRAYERIVGEAQPDEEDDELKEPHPMQGNCWVIQCKREKEIGPKRLAAILNEIDSTNPPYGYVLAASVNFSKASYDAFRTALLNKGVMEFYLWGKPELEGMLHLPKNDRILFTFFGISLVSRRRSRSTEIRGRVSNKNKLLRAFNQETGYFRILLRDSNDEHYPFENAYPDFDANPRWKRFEGRRIHPQGLIVRQRQWFAYADFDTREFDFTEAVSLLSPQSDFPDEDWEKRQKEQGARDRVEDFWDHLPNANRVEFARNGLVRYEDMLVIDDKGISPDKCPHIFIDFQGNKGPFARFSEFLEIPRGYGDPERIFLDGFKRVPIFPKEFPAPTIGTVHSEGAVQLSEQMHRLVVNGNESVKEFCVLGEKYPFLKSRDIFVLKSGEDPALRGATENDVKYFQITHVRKTTVGEHVKGDMQDHRKGELERELKQPLSDSDPLTIFEFKQTYDWRIERVKDKT